MPIEPCSSAGSELNRYERILLRHARPQGFASMAAESSRHARHSVPAETATDRALRDLSAGVVAPVLVGYVLWILKQARQRGIRRVYFVSRDGQILLAIARKLALRLELDCELKYLYGSRRALYLPRIATTAGEDQANLLRELCSGTVQAALTRLSLEREEVERPLTAVGLPPQTWNKPLAPPHLQVLREVISRDPVWTILRARAREAHELLLGYARQEGLTVRSPWALVDSCGQGTMINALTRVVADDGGAPPAAFYFNLKEGGRVDDSLGTRQAYFADARSNQGFVDLIEQSDHIEIACTGDHGMVVGYARSAEQVVPVLAEECNQAAFEAGLPLVRSSIHSFLDRLLADDAALHPEADLRMASAELMKALWLSPTDVEARAWGANLSPEKEMPLIKPFGWSSLPLNLLRTLLLPTARPRNGAYWVAGSLAVSPPGVRWLLNAGARVGRGSRGALEGITSGFRSRTA